MTASVKAHPFGLPPTGFAAWAMKKKTNNYKLPISL